MIKKIDTDDYYSAFILRKTTEVYFHKIFEKSKFLINTEKNCIEIKCPLCRKYMSTESDFFNCEKCNSAQLSGYLTKELPNQKYSHTLYINSLCLNLKDINDMIRVNISDDIEVIIQYALEDDVKQQILIYKNSKENKKQLIKKEKTSSIKELNFSTILDTYNTIATTLEKPTNLLTLV